MRLPSPHVAPYRKFTPSVTVVTRPSASEIVRNAPVFVTSPTERPSGAKNVAVALSEPRNAMASNWSSERR